MNLFDVDAIEKKYPLPTPEAEAGDGALYVHALRFQPKTVIWSAWILTAFSVMGMLAIAILGYRLYALFSPGLTPEQDEFLTTIIILLIALGLLFGLGVYYLSTRLVSDAFERWYYLTDDFVEYGHRGNIRKIYWKDVRKKKFWSLFRFQQAKVSTYDQTIVFTINFVKAHPKPQQVKAGIFGIRLVYENGDTVRLEDAQKEIFEDVRKRLQMIGTSMRR